jgi:hypothetical protein
MTTLLYLHPQGMSVVVPSPSQRVLLTGCPQISAQFR